MLATLERSSQHVSDSALVSPYYHDHATAADCQPDAVRNITYFYGGGVDGQRDGYYLRRRLFAERARMPERTVLVSTGPAWLNDTAYEVLPNCTDLSAETCTQCQGSYVNAELLSRSQFTLSPRGDSPSTARLYDAAQYCSIPVLISDTQFELASPFQCFVPYELFTVQIPEAEWEADPVFALESTAGALAPWQVERMRQAS